MKSTEKSVVDQSKSLVEYVMNSTVGLTSPVFLEFVFLCGVFGRQYVYIFLLYLEWWKVGGVVFETVCFFRERVSVVP